MIEKKFAIEISADYWFGQNMIDVIVDRLNREILLDQFPDSRATLIAQPVDGERERILTRALRRTVRLLHLHMLADHSDSDHDEAGIDVCMAHSCRGVKALLDGAEQDTLSEAAPDLLAALEKIVSACDTCDGEGVIEYQPPGIDGHLPTGDANFVTEDCPSCSAARAAIQKARAE